jgi:hypothetical protein
MHWQLTVGHRRTRHIYQNGQADLDNQLPGKWIATVYGELKGVVELDMVADVTTLSLQ